MSPLVITRTKMWLGFLRQPLWSATGARTKGRDAMSYVTVFEITHDSSLWWWPSPIGTLVFGLFATIFLLLMRDLWFITKVLRSFVFLFACLWVVLLAYKPLDRRRYVQAYENGKYTVVEGPVEHYSWKGKTECFSVRGVEFCRGTGNPDQLAWPIGLTSERLPVRIAYSEMNQFPKILRLEIGRNSR
jgi:hypothetical protein